MKHKQKDLVKRLNTSSTKPNTIKLSNVYTADFSNLNFNIDPIKCLDGTRVIDDIIHKNPQKMNEYLTALEWVDRLYLQKDASSELPELKVSNYAKR